MAATPLTAWLDALVLGVGELASTTLGVPHDQSDDVASVPEGPGACIQIAGGQQSLHVSLVAPHEACQALARMLFGMEAGDDISEDDVADAMGEAVNMIAGSAKRKMGDEGSHMQLGLPFYSDGGHVQFAGSVETATRRVRVGEVDARLSVVRAGGG